MNEVKPLRAAIFWDRDGTLIEDRGHLARPDDVVFLPGAVNALRQLQDDFVFFIVTHQPGVALGAIGIDDVDRVNCHVVSQLAAAGVEIAEVYVCPHERADGCDCIKPKPYFLHKAAENYGVSLRHSFVVGDHPHDVELAERAGAQGVYVCTGHGLRHLDELHEDKVVVPDIRAAAEWILSRRPFDRMRHGVGGANTAGYHPEIAPTAYVHPTATVIGRVRVGDRAFVGPHATIRADEAGPDGAIEPIVISECANVQDGAVIHALGGTGVTIGPRASIAHAAVIHGPCQIGGGCFVGFNSVVFRATLGDGAVVMHQALVEGTVVPEGLLVPSMTAVRCDEDVRRLLRVTPDVVAFVEGVINANLLFAQAGSRIEPLGLRRMGANSGVD